jgi:dynein heavy chain
MVTSEIKDEIFLEYINSILLTGEVPGLFAKDEMMAMCGDIRSHFIRERPGKTLEPFIILQPYNPMTPNP